MLRTHWQLEGPRVTCSDSVSTLETVHTLLARSGRTQTAGQVQTHSQVKVLTLARSISKVRCKHISTLARSGANTQPGQGANISKVRVHTAARSGHTCSYYRPVTYMYTLHVHP